MKVLGIDPGVTGAWAVIEYLDGKPHVLDIGDLPVKVVQMTKRVTRRIEPTAFSELIVSLIERHSPDRLVVERLTGAPNITSTTAFSLGWTAAVLDTVLTALGQGHYLTAHPSAWKRALLVPADKSAAKHRATKLFGSNKHWKRELDHNRAEAALIALWGALTRR